jgi:ACS family glucarate transporter-like MFS transporter
MTSISAAKTDTADPGPSGRSRATKVRWAVAVFCAFGLAINYIDRSAISVSLPFMTQDFSLTPTEKGLILSAFSWSYALMQIPAGRLIDRFGERVIFGASVLVWSVFTAATAGVSSFAALLGLRLGLGVGEAGAYPAAAKTVSHWFPLRLRGRATSVYDSGARIGSAAATPLIALIIGLFGWRAAFLFAGGLGILWAIGWWAWYRRPEFKSSVNDAELAIIHESHREQHRSRRQADAHRRSVQAAHRLGHDARVLLPELHDHLLPHLVPLIPGRGARIQSAQARCLRHDPAACGHPGQLGRRTRR